ncbi:Hypothetical_protein [Hexamita inflata]|uniref:Hypothetical_protein n=1 Tax=Hexamita inflata TaxID=28002 RepID=A0AA86RR90_9EUKA|nr:Hypothetical protein HINF_LOCUS64224 [Hexamita inflata]
MLIQQQYIICTINISNQYKHIEIDVEQPSANRFASLADSDVQFQRTDNYIHEKGMMKVATQSPIKEVSLQSQDIKTLKKPTRQRLKRSPLKQQKKATINWRTRPQRNNLTTQPDQSNPQCERQ